MLDIFKNNPVFQIELAKIVFFASHIVIEADLVGIQY